MPTAPDEPIRSGIDDLLAKLRAAAATPADLARLQRALLSADPRQAIAAILAFLKTGQDATTGEPFAPGPNGGLETAPSLRVLLLDVLGRLSRKIGSADADAIGRTILAAKTSPDEWAIAMRNIAWHDPTATPYLGAKFREMLGHEPWLNDPSSGFLEAFDVAVYAKDATLIPTLGNMLSSNKPELQRAAAVALDRLAESTPLAVMTYLNGSPTTLADLPFVRADFFAKADLSQQQQRSAVEFYLSRSDVSPAEKAKLLKGLATPASFVSDNLLTESTPPADETPRVQAAGNVAAEWLKTNRFPELSGELQRLQSRAKPR